MDSIWLILMAGALFLVSYVLYGGFVARRLGVDPKRPTPAHTMYDGVDYVPAKAPVLLGHHFASIAGAGPIIGPVTAAIFGWVPVYLWIVLGSIFIGAVHDFSSLVASIRHSGKSIGEIIEEHIGDLGKKLFLIFSWSTLVLIISVFIIVVAKTFVSVPASATASVFFIFLAVAFGVTIYRIGWPLLWATLVGVVLLFGGVYLGIVVPLKISFNIWVAILLGYIFVASVTPVWILLQPRDYLNSFLLYALILGAVLGIFIGRPSYQLDIFGGFATDLGLLFPILFVTVACGAISGFHCLVASGTTAKQLNKESDARLIGYGGMLIEGVLAIVALSAAAILLRGQYQHVLAKEGPIVLFSKGVGSFIHSLGIPTKVGITFAALAVSAFALTSLDTATRLARFAFQEFFEPVRSGPAAPGGAGGKATILTTNRFIATTVTVFCAGILAITGQWRAIWPIFGSANQLMAALALLSVSVWLARVGRSNLFALLPMVFMFAVTLSALVVGAIKNFQGHNFLLMAISILLFLVAIILVMLAYQSLRKRALAQAIGSKGGSHET